MAKKIVVPKYGFVFVDTLPTCTTEQSKVYAEKAHEFINATKFYSSSDSAACAVAEYLAYQDGFTIRDKV